MDSIKELKAKAKKVYETTISVIEKNAFRYRKTDVLFMKVKDAFPDCTVNVDHNSYQCCVSLHLTKEFNVSKDVLLFLDNNLEFLEFFGREKQYEVDHQPEYSCFTYSWGDQRLSVWYGNGNCTRKVIGHKTKTITEDIYEVVCN
jgi:hypothetical protein